MLTEHDQEICNYMQENYGGKCAYNFTKLCDGLCNNCFYNLPNHGFGRHILFGAVRADNYPDYEELILAKQENDNL